VAGKLEGRAGRVVVLITRRPVTRPQPFPPGLGTDCTRRHAQLGRDLGTGRALRQALPEPVRPFRWPHIGAPLVGPRRLASGTDQYRLKQSVEGCLLRTLHKVGHAEARRPSLTFVGVPASRVHSSDELECEELPDRGPLQHVFRHR
jgi:hypothetical protein